MSIADLQRDRQYHTQGGGERSRSKHQNYEPKRRSDSKSLAGVMVRASSGVFVQATLGRVQQQNALTYSGIIGDARQVLAIRQSEPTTAKHVLERFEGFVIRVEGELAHVRLVNDRGDQLVGAYPAAELASKGVGERDRFVLATVDRGNSVHFDIDLIPRRTVSPEEQRAVRESIKQELGDYTPEDDY